MQASKNISSVQEKGVSLLIVLLLGSMMILAALGAAQYALNSLRQAEVQSDATHGLFTAESAFQCVRYWVIKDTKYFPDGAPLADPNIQCNGTTISGLGSSYNAATNPHGFITSSSLRTWKFRIPDSIGSASGVDVEVERDTSVTQFKGYVRVSGYSDDLTSSRVVQRYQEYYLEWPHRLPADVMFVIDRSGSISRTDALEWDAMNAAVVDALNFILAPGSDIRVGFLSFGSNYTDTGNPYNPGCTSGGNCTLLAEQRLTNNLVTLVSGSSPNYINSNEALTNMSLGLAIANAELLNKYYPSGPAGDVPYNAGAFEAGLVTELNKPVGTRDLGRAFLNLQDQGVNGKGRTPDSGLNSFPNFIILITDGEPNAFMTNVASLPGTYSCHAWGGSSGDAGGYSLGMEKVFDTGNPGTGCFIDYSTALPFQDYTYCADGTTVTPTSYLGSGYGSVSPNQALCHTTIVADAIRMTGTTIAVIGVTTDVNDSWLQNEIADKPEYYVYVDNFNDVFDAIALITERLQLTTFK